MTKLMSAPRDLLALVLFTLFTSTGTAIEIEIVSGGKVVSTLTAGAFADQDVAREREFWRGQGLRKQALGERADALLIAQAYSSAFLECEPSSPRGIAVYKGREALQTMIDDSFFFTMDDPGHIILISTAAQRGAIIKLSDYSVITPQCPVGVKRVFWSASAQQALFITQSVSEVKALPSNSQLWTARFAKEDIAHVYSAVAGMRKLLSFDKEIVVDGLMLETSNSVYILTKKDSFSGNSPIKLLGALAGHPVSGTDIYLWHIGVDGKVAGKERLAKSVENGSARFRP